MPTLSDLQRFHPASTSTAKIDSGNDELVTDSRARVTPSQFVERKLLALATADRGNDRREFRLKHAK